MALAMILPGQDQDNDRDMEKGLERGGVGQVAEVEVKARVPSVAAAEDAIRRAGGAFVREALQEDVYLRHPCRDLVVRDEALRLRREGDAGFLTFKGRREGGDAKTREEQEVGLEVAGFDQALAIFERLGFSPAAKIVKRRREFRVGGAEVVIDAVDGLGIFIEVEVKARTGTGKSKGKDARQEMEAGIGISAGTAPLALDEARRELFSITDRLGIGRERLLTDSYLELLASRSSDSRAER